jgi:ribonuclease BN (tRNA processing enzyme)
LKLAFLGTGAAFSVERYNGAFVVDGRLLMDAGAPLLPHLHRLGIEPSAIDAVLLTHFHGDHILGLPPFLLHRAFVNPRPLPILGPPGVAQKVDALQELCWGDEWPEFRRRAQVSYVEAGSAGEIAGVPYETVLLKHGGRIVTGYRLRLGDRVLAYSGDTEGTDELDDLVRGADVAVVEATAPGPTSSHVSWEQAAELTARHPRTRFLFNHLYAGEIEGAVSDLQEIEI